ncbi:MAG: DUF4149 domain-containing protein [Pseudomonadota bacterium]
MEFVAFGIVSASLGGMLFFGAIIAPLLFSRLSEADSGGFVRAMFPRYYLVFGIASLAAAIFAALDGAVVSAIILFVIFLGFAVARQILMPAINRARDSGDEIRFERLHKGSVYLNAVQLVGFVATLFMIAR